MEHGFGGMFMIRIMIVFVFIYVMFIGIALNIAKAYRIKNGVINILEQYQFEFDNDVAHVLPNTLGDEDSLLVKYLNDIPYSVDSQAAIDHCNNINDPNHEIVKRNADTGVCILQVGNASKYHYKVYVYMSVDFPLFGLNHKLIPVSGETITMEK